MKKIVFLLVVLSTFIYSQAPCPETPIVNYEGKTYNTVQIGTQCWLKENLNVGNRINIDQNASNNVTIEKYCYNDDENNCNTYGGLYQWNEAIAYSTIPGTKDICPDGWHIPTKAEFETLAAAVTNNSNALKEIGQGMGSGAGTNTSGFSALLAGARDIDSHFHRLGYDTYFWSSTGSDSDNAYGCFLYSSDSRVDFGSGTNLRGYSIRCLKDGATAVESDNEKGIPTEYSLAQNYPNPFNPSSIINFTLPKSSHVLLKVYDLLGKEITTLVDKELSAGYHEVSFDGSALPSGIYFYEIKTGDFAQTKKMILTK